MIKYNITWYRSSQLYFPLTVQYHLYMRKIGFLFPYTSPVCLEHHIDLTKATDIVIISHACSIKSMCTNDLCPGPDRSNFKEQGSCKCVSCCKHVIVHTYRWWIFPNNRQTAVYQHLYKIHPSIIFTSYFLYRLQGVPVPITSSHCARSKGSSQFHHRTTWKQMRQKPFTLSLICRDNLATNYSSMHVFSQWDESGVPL